MLCCIAWREESIPTEWRQGIVVPLHKDGDERDPMNYRGITLLSIVGKVFTRVLNNRLTKFAERKTFGIVEENGGVRAERHGGANFHLCRSAQSALRAYDIHCFYRCEKSV